MRLYLIRHAHAGTRTFDVDDIDRPLSERGWAQARQIVTQFESTPISRVISSPAQRCVETVAPLAQARSLEIDRQPDLWETASLPHVLALLNTMNETGVVACSHGNIIPEVIQHLAHDGLRVKGRGCEKSSVWVLDHDGVRWVRAQYFNPGDPLGGPGGLAQPNQTPI